MLIISSTLVPTITLSSNLDGKGFKVCNLKMMIQIKTRRTMCKCCCFISGKFYCHVGGLVDYGVRLAFALCKNVFNTNTYIFAVVIQI